MAKDISAELMGKLVKRMNGEQYVLLSTVDEQTGTPVVREFLGFMPQMGNIFTSRWVTARG